MGDLTKDFSVSEFACKDGCGFNAISLPLVQEIQEMRDILGPLKINCGCRCPKHNKEVGGKPNSAHLRGFAADIHCDDNLDRYKMLVEVMKRFRRFEICKTWIHVDVDSSLPQDVAILG